MNTQQLLDEIESRLLTKEKVNSIYGRGRYDAQKTIVKTENFIGDTFIMCLEGEYKIYKNILDAGPFNVWIDEIPSNSSKHKILEYIVDNIHCAFDKTLAGISVRIILSEELKKRIKQNPHEI